MTLWYSSTCTTYVCTLFVRAQQSLEESSTPVQPSGQRDNLQGQETTVIQWNLSVTVTHGPKISELELSGCNKEVAALHSDHFTQIQLYHSHVKLCLAGQ